MVIRDMGQDKGEWTQSVQTEQFFGSFGVHFVTKRCENSDLLVVIEVIAVARGQGFDSGAGYNGTRCRQQLATVTMFLHSCVAQVLCRENNEDWIFF